MNREEKQAQVDFLQGAIKKSQIALVANYHGLNATEISNLRSKLREGKAEGKVVKNTLARLAIRQALPDDQGAELDKFLAALKGPTFLVYSDVDPIQPAKAIQDFIKSKDTFTVRAAWVDGTFVDAKGVEALSKMPGKEEVLSMLLRLLNEPATQLVRLLNAPAQQTVQVIEAQRKKLEG